MDEQNTETDLERTDSLAVLARALYVGTPGLQATLDQIVMRAADAAPRARFAGLLLVIKGQLVPQATTGNPPHVLDLLQQRTGAGPCVDAAQQQTVQVIADTGSDERWPDFAAEAVALGVCSMLCVPLWVDERTLGTLSLYADIKDAFDEQDRSFLELYATLAALALAAAQQADHLQAALHNRDVIGQAKGILMERRRITAEAAFALLSTASQAQNKKLAAVAEDLVQSGELEIG